MIRRYDEPVRHDVRYKTRPGAYAVLVRDGKILLTWQGAPHDELQLPGGGIDPGEGPLDALYREVFEETGWRITNPRKFGVFRRYCYMPEYGFWAEKICHIYVATPVLRLGPPSEAGHTAVWADQKHVAEIITGDGNRAMVRGVLKQRAQVS
jgi:8-oxo-dGTP diphosphatase